MKALLRKEFNKFIKEPPKIPHKRFWGKYKTSILHHTMMILVTAAITILLIHYNFQLFPKYYSPQLHVTCSFPCKCALDGPVVVCEEKHH